jgi:hypothetical protein
MPARHADTGIDSAFVHPAATAVVVTRASWQDRAMGATVSPLAWRTAMTDTTEFEAAAFRRLVAHLRARTDVQNIDLMNLAGFCRNCLADWYREAAEAAGETLSKDAARERVYGMTYAEWKEKIQR